MAGSVLVAHVSLVELAVPFRPALVHLYGRQHIDLQRVAGALCRG